MLLTFLENCFVRQVLLFHSLCDWKDWVDLQTKITQHEFRDTNIAMFRLGNLSRPPIFLLQTLDFDDISANSE